jgi:hypothetical protein
MIPSLITIVNKSPIDDCKLIEVVQATGHSLKQMIASLMTIINQSPIDDCNSAGHRTLFKMNDSITYDNRQLITNC